MNFYFDDYVSAMSSQLARLKKFVRLILATLAVSSAVTVALVLLGLPVVAFIVFTASTVGVQFVLMKMYLEGERSVRESMFVLEVAERKRTTVLLLAVVSMILVVVVLCFLALHLFAVKFV